VAIANVFECSVAADSVFIYTVATVSVFRQRVALGMSASAFGLFYFEAELLTSYFYQSMCI
jgi:hypothetical protein